MSAKIVIVATLFLWQSILQTASASIIDSCTFGTTTYYLITPASWLKAQAEADRIGGHLVTINSQGEQDFLLAEFGRSALAHPAARGRKVNLWIGLSRASRTAP